MLLTNMERIILEYIKYKNELIEKEQYYLDIYYDNQQNCYNICPTAGSPLGRKYPDEIILNNIVKQGGKPFYVFKGKEFIGEWINQSECSRTLNIDRSYITWCLSNRRKKSNGYIFIYKDEYSEEKLNEMYDKLGLKPFLVFNKYTKELIKEYDFPHECIKDLKVSIYEVNKCLKKEKNYISAKDFIFIYKDEYTDEKFEELYNKSFCVYKKNNGEFVGEFKNTRDCESNLNVDSRKINACLRNAKYSADGFIFIFVKDCSEDKLNDLRNKSLCSFQFEVYNKNTNEFVGSYENQNECARELGLNNTCVNNCLTGNQKYTKNYIFKKIS